MMTRFVSIMLLGFLYGCSTVPPKAVSIKDYCLAVAETAQQVELWKIQGTPKDLAEVRFILMGDNYPKRELDKILEVVNMVYSGVKVETIYNTCMEQRTNNTWFKS